MDVVVHLVGRDDLLVPKRGDAATAFCGMPLIVQDALSADADREKLPQLLYCNGCVSQALAVTLPLNVIPIFRRL